ncbi:MAG: hypothetical protein WKF94_18935 [Solirubrobacteraceae bacterium]
MTNADFEKRRRKMLRAVAANLEGVLPPGTPVREGGKRGVWHALADHLRVDELREPLQAIAAGPGHELRETGTGQVAMGSVESSALMTVNFFAPFAKRAGSLFGLSDGTLTFEKELRVTGVRAPVGPTLDAALDAPGGSVFVEAKSAEPWRGPPKVSLSTQYDAPAKAHSPETLITLEALRSGDLTYTCLDAAQFLKHLLGIATALERSIVTGSAKLCLLFWRPADAGPYADMFNRLEAEFDDLAARLDDQDVELVRRGTTDLLDDWFDGSKPKWLQAHAAALRCRYDQPLTG